MKDKEVMQENVLDEMMEMNRHYRTMRDQNARDDNLSDLYYRSLLTVAASIGTQCAVKDLRSLYDSMVTINGNFRKAGF